MQAATPSADRVARAKRRHPEWFPARHFDRLSSKVYFALGMTTAQCDAASADRFLQADLARWKAVATAANIRVE